MYCDCGTLQASCFELTPKSGKSMGENASMRRGVAESSKDEGLDVYIWDMDETLILLKSLLTGTYAEGFNGVKNVQEGVEIGKKWEKKILSLCDDHFFYEQVSCYTYAWIWLNVYVSFLCA